MADVLLFQTKQLLEADMIADALEQASVPYYRRQEVGTLQHAMPLAPANWFATSWLIIVPEEVIAEAQAAVEGLPFFVSPVSSEAPYDPSGTLKPQNELPEALRKHWLVFVLLFVLLVMLVCYLILVPHVLG